MFWELILGERRHDKLRQQLRPLLPSYWVEKFRWPVMKGPLVWNGSELDPSNFTYSLSTADVNEIRRALDRFKELDLDGPEINADNFTLPTLGPKLRNFANVIHSGPGFYVLQGLKLPRHSVEDRTLAFLGVSSYIGEQRAMQNWNGDMLTHIVDPSLGENVGRVGEVSTKIKEDANAYSGIPQHHHTEDQPCDIVAFDVRSPSSELFSLASAWEVYNRLRAGDFTRLSIFDNQKGAALLYARTTGRSVRQYYKADPHAELSLHQGKIIMSIAGKYNTGPGWLSFARAYSSGIVREVDDHARATSFSLRLNDGDLLFINNLALLHRIASPSETERHIVRMWLRNESLRWVLPSDMEAKMREVYNPSDPRRRWELRPLYRFEPQYATKKVSTTATTQTERRAADNVSIGGASFGGGSFGGGSFGGGGGGGGSIGGWS